MREHGVNIYVLGGFGSRAGAHSDAALVIALRAAAVQIRVDTSIF